MEKMITLEQLVELSMLTETADEIPWDKINIGKENAYGMMAAHVIDMLDEDKEAADREIVMMSVMVKLLVENFALQLIIRENLR